MSIADASRITIGYTVVYSMSIINQSSTKFRMIQKYGKEFDRYNSKEMHNADRLVGNMMEWTPIFMGPLWALASADKLSERCKHVAWAYVGVRLLYTILQIRRGVAQNGLNKQLWVATFPGYALLMYLFFASVDNLFF